LVKLYGYSGKILYVDLTKEKIGEENLDYNLLTKIIGGSGLASYIIYRKLSEIKHPEDPSNILVFATGPLTLEEVPNSGRITVASLSPLTGIWGETHIGTRFAIELKKAGFDAIVVSGKAEKPMFIYINDGNVELKDASKYWGKDIIETIHEIRKDLNDPSLKILTIGPAGERKVKISIIANEEGFGGRCGLGAVMGSKNLKAVVVKGSNKISIAYPSELKEYVKNLVKKLLQGGTNLRKYGSAGGVKGYHLIGNLPIKNFTLGRWDDAKVHNISGESIAQKYLKAPFACTFCPVSCKRLLEVRNGKYYREFKGIGLEYETVALLGSNLLIDDLEAIIKSNDLCDRLGIDTISVGNLIGALFEAAEKGLISKEIDGLRLEWGNAEAVHELIRKIAYREGIGDILAEGVKKASEKLGFKELAVHVKGLEIPAHDGRAYFSHALSFATMNRGGDHLGWPHMPYRGFAAPEIGISAKQNRYDDSIDMVETVIKMQNLMIVFDSLVLCKYAFTSGLTVTDILNLLKYVTGREFTADDLMSIGDRIWKIQRKINNELGVTRKDDVLPPKLLTRHANRDDTKVPPINEWIPIYYKLRNLDEDGIVRSLDIDTT